MPLSRRVLCHLPRADASCAGVALATVPARYFQDDCDDFKRGHKGAMLPALDHGTLMHLHGATALGETHCASDCAIVTIRAGVRACQSSPEVDPAIDAGMLSAQLGRALQAARLAGRNRAMATLGDLAPAWGAWAASGSARTAADSGRQRRTAPGAAGDTP